jgi:hypothetical protein
MKPIIFFNHYHNGDLFASKAFIKEIVDNVDVKVYYGHENNPIVLSDINLETVSLPQVNYKTKFINADDAFYINTWIGSYFDYGGAEKECCTLKFSYDMFDKIYEAINQVYSTNLKLSSMEDYFPSIDFSKFQLKNIDTYIKSDSNKKILFCNGPSMSGQCLYTGDMKPVIENLASNYPNITFIATQTFDTDIKNIKFTNDIIKLNQCDLNEIGYLSTFCNIIVGRNSGPHCFAANKLNVNDPSKVFYAFGQDPKVSLYYGVDLGCSFVYEVFDSLDVIEKSIEELILEL